MCHNRCMIKGISLKKNYFQTCAPCRLNKDEKHPEIAETPFKRRQQVLVSPLIITMVGGRKDGRPCNECCRIHKLKKKIIPKWMIKHATINPASILIQLSENLTIYIIVRNFQKGCILLQPTFCHHRTPLSIRLTIFNFIALEYLSLITVTDV